MIKPFHLKEKLSLLLHHQLTMVVGVGLVIGTVFSFISINHEPKAIPAKSLDEALVSKLNELQSHLVSLEETAKKPLPEIDFSSLEQKLKHLNQEVSELKQFNPEALNERIETRLGKTEENLTTQLVSISQTVSELQAKTEKVKYLPIKALPFAVISIDSIQSRAVASIQYDFKTTPFEKGENLAGWKIVALDFGHQRIEFENKNKERVLLKQENIG